MTKSEFTGQTVEACRSKSKIGDSVISIAMNQRTITFNRIAPVAQPDRATDF